jgi:malate synthase
MPCDIAETLFVNPMTDIYNSLRTILRDNSIVTAETQEEQQRIAKMVDSMVKVQNELVKQTKNSQIEMLLSKMTRDIKDNIGNTITQDTEDLLNQFSGNFEAIDNNFNSLKQRIDELESKLIEKVAEVKDVQLK